MTVRPLDLLDLPALYRYRGEAASLDSTRALTRGSPLGTIGLMAYVNPRRHVYSAVCRDNGAVMVGGVIHSHGESYARMLYLAPESGLDHPALPALIENLSIEAGNWGAFHVLAELDELSPAFTPLRRAGFVVYAGQRMWDVTPSEGRKTGDLWPRVQSENLPSVQNLYHQIVPPLLQPIEPMPRRAAGFICGSRGICYATTYRGLNGIVVFPLIHPDATDVAPKLQALIQNLPNRAGRPVYVCVRTYQAWLEHVLEDLGAKPGPQQAMLVKHLARLVKEPQAVLARQPAQMRVQPSRMSRMEEKKQGT
ncbi:MAG: hypothetical protein ACK2T0_10290 [Anaerolineales bacterium]|jgi:hypothetical protein